MRRRLNRKPLPLPSRSPFPPRTMTRQTSRANRGARAGGSAHSG